MEILNLGKKDMYFKNDIEIGIFVRTTPAENFTWHAFLKSEGEEKEVDPNHPLVQDTFTNGTEITKEEYDAA